MTGIRIFKEALADFVSYGPRSSLRMLVGDDDGTTPVRVGLQVCEPHYVVPIHSHPYVEYLMMLQGAVELHIEGDTTAQYVVQQGDTAELPAHVWHGFTAISSQTVRLLGIHVSSKRIAFFRPGVAVDARGYRIDLATDRTGVGTDSL